MGQRLQSVVSFFAINTIILGVLAVLSLPIQAQSLLLPGDVTIVTVNSSSNTFDIIPLVDIEEGTRLFVSNSVLQQTQDGLNAQANGIITFTSSVRAGTNLSISDEVSTELELSGELNLSSQADSLYLFQKEGSIQRFLFGISWGDQHSTKSVHLLPEMLNSESNTWISLGEGSNHQYHLKHGASGTSAMLLDMVADSSHWRSSDNEFMTLGTSFRLLKAPVVVFASNVSNVIESDSIQLDIAIYGHDGSRLTVDLELNSIFSSADSGDVHFSKKTFNFSGLIGDDIRSVRIPISDDSKYEGNETAFFELNNLSTGQFGDFINHVVLIQDDEIPDVSISNIVYTGNRKTDFIEITNNESVELDISDWVINDRSFSRIIGNNSILPPLGSLKIHAPKRQKKNTNSTEKWFASVSGTVKLFNSEGVQITSKKYKLTDIIARSESEKVRKETNQIEKKMEPIAPEQGAAIASVLGTTEAVPAKSKMTQQNEPRVEKGWFVLSDIQKQQEEVKDYHFWDESKASYMLYEDSRLDTTISGPVFYYKKEALKATEPEVFEQDSEFVSTDNAMLEEIHEVTFTLSATDVDENGLINDAEGFNFLSNTTSDSLPVSALISTFESEIGSSIIQPEVLLWPEDGSGWQGVEVLSGSGKIPPQRAFWVKVDSVLNSTSVLFETKFIEQGLALNTDVYVEPEAHLRIKVSNTNKEQSIDINWYAEGETIPLSKLRPELNPELSMSESDFLQIGGYYNRGWNKEINIAEPMNTRLVIPLGISSSTESQFTLSVEEWMTNGGWRVFLEEQEMEEQEEVEQTWSKNFEYSFISNKEFKVNNRSEIYGSFSKFVDTRYQLVVYPPGVEVEKLDNPVGFELFQNYPNPFNPATTISFYLPENAEVKLLVFNVVGQPIATLEQGMLNAGEHQYEWNATGYPSGMYIYQLEVGTNIMTRKMTLVK